MFQPTPRLFGEGNEVSSLVGSLLGGFNPPPACSARGTVAVGKPDDDVVVSTHPPPVRRGEPPHAPWQGHASSGFNPPPACSARGTCPCPHTLIDRLFQPTPRLFGEGNLSRLGDSRRQPVSTHPPPVRRGELYTNGFGGTGYVAFQPTPRLFGEGNASRALSRARVGVFQP